MIINITVENGKQNQFMGLLFQICKKEKSCVSLVDSHTGEDLVMVVVSKNYQNLTKCV